MKEFRKDKNCTEYYSSLEELRAGWGLDPIEKKRTKDMGKLQAQREKFLGTCRACKSPMKYVSSKYSVCSNENCRGINIAKKGEEPRYVLSIREFDSKGETIAKNLFD